MSGDRSLSKIQSPRDHPIGDPWPNEPLIRRRRGEAEVLGGVRKTEEELRRGLDGYIPSNQELAVVDVTDDRFIGCCGVLHGDVQVILSLDRRGRGIGPALIPYLVELSTSEGHSPFGAVHPENLRSLALMKKLGWSQVGIVTKEGWQQGHLIFQPTHAA